MKEHDKVIKKSHSTIDFNSSKTEKMLDEYSKYNIQKEIFHAKTEEIYSSQICKKKFDFQEIQEIQEIQKRDNKNPHLRRNLERRVTTYFDDQEKDYRPIYQDYGECPTNCYRLIIFKSEPNTINDKIFFNNPRNFVEPNLLIAFDTNNSNHQKNTSYDLTLRLKCIQRDNFTTASNSSIYYNMSQIVQNNKTLRPSNYHDLNALEEDFSFPEDQPKTQAKSKPQSFGLEGAIKIDDETYEINGFRFKIQNPTQKSPGLSSSKSAQNLHTSNQLHVSKSPTINRTLTRTKGDTQYKSYSNLHQRSHTTNENLSNQYNTNNPTQESVVINNSILTNNYLQQPQNRNTMINESNIYFTNSSI